MMNKELKVVCFGEILWDVLPTGRRPGGAPMNVAYHLNRLGVNSTLISRIGNDALGVELMDFLLEKSLPTDYIQIDPVYKTSEVLATIGENNEVSYEIVKPVAWDFIEYNDECEELVIDADILVFGSLAARNNISRETLGKLIKKAKFKFFDVNFRAPHYTKETVEYLLQQTDALKLNEHEAGVIAEWMGISTTNEHAIITEIMERYHIQEVILTKGSLGASYYTPTGRRDYQAYSVVVKDTIGSGDSFLAAFIAQKLMGKSLDDALNYANALGAYVTTQSGATPDYEIADLNHFIEKRIGDSK